MEFWGAEVKSGHNFEVELEKGSGRILHISQVALGEVTADSKKEKGKETVCIYLKFKNEKFVIGTLSQEKFPHVALDLVLHDKFELSHNWKNGSVYFTGYHVDTSRNSDTESEEEAPELIMNPVKSQATSSIPIELEPKKDEDSSDDDDAGDDSSAEDEESGEDQEPNMLVNGENESDDDDSEEVSSDEDQETPEKAEPSKKRSAESATKTPAPVKKAKLVTPEKTVHSGAEGKKVSGHTATPHPSKKSGKASAAAAATQSKQAPNTGGSFPCKSCGRSFGSDNALQSHSKAKHGTPA